jgi:diguanylate cyclase (GGDEF)-like protein
MAREAPRAARGQLGLALAIVALVLLLSAAAAWAAGRLQERSASEAADARLESSLRAANAEMRLELAAAGAKARVLAASPKVQRALFRHDADALARITAEDENNVSFAFPGGAEPGAGFALRRAVEVTGPKGRELGRVVVGIPVGRELVDRLSTAAGVPEGDDLAVVEDGRFLTEEPDIEDRRSMWTPLAAGTALRLVAFAPNEPIAASTEETQRRVFLAALLTLALLGLAWWSVTRHLDSRAVSETAPRRRSKDLDDATSPSRRAREAVALVGEALAATHDPDALLPVIVESAVGATGAVGARLVTDGTERVRAGQPEAGGPPLSVSLGTGSDHVGSLLIYPYLDRPFNEDEGRLAHWLAAQASIALENARLHRAVEQQAITDDLTGLANRRRFGESLSLEVSRAERFGGTLALVLADLDDFKLVNDLYGHQVGDQVLRRFADLMRESVREFDLAVRHGGEEFAVLLPETDVDGGVRLAERLAEALREARFVDRAGKHFTVTSSFGVAAFPGARTAEDLMLAADRALYRAKEDGKNRVIRGDSRS